MTNLIGADVERMRAPATSFDDSLAVFSSPGLNRDSVGYEASHGQSEYPMMRGTSFQQSLAALLAGHPDEIPGR